MSPKTASEVYRYRLPRTQQAVLLAFADHVNGERAKRGDSVVWPGLGRVAWMTGLDRRTVALAKQALVELGALVEVRKARHHHPAAYRIVLSALPLKPPYEPARKRVPDEDWRVSSGAPPPLRSGAPPPLRSGAPPPLASPEGAVPASEGAVPTSSRGGAAPPKPRREPRREPSRFLASLENGAHDARRHSENEGAEPKDEVRLDGLAPPARSDPKGGPIRSATAAPESEIAVPTTVTEVATTASTSTTTSSARRMPQVTEMNARKRGRPPCAACGHLAWQHRPPRDVRVLAGERPEGECVVNDCACASPAPPEPRNDEVYPRPGLAAEVAALPEPVRAWWSATLALGIATGRPVQAWQTGVVDVLDRYAETGASEAAP